MDAWSGNLGRRMAQDHSEGTSRTPVVVRCARQAVRGNSVMCEDVLGEACTAVEEKLHNF